MGTPFQELSQDLRGLSDQHFSCWMIGYLKRLTGMVARYEPGPRMFWMFWVLTVSQPALEHSS